MPSMPRLSTHSGLGRYRIARASDSRSDMPLHLSARDRRLLRGDAGDGARLAMRLVVKAAEVAGATRLIDIGSAHVGSCYSAGTVGLDFARRLADTHTRVAVPATLNTAAADLLHCAPPGRRDPGLAETRELVDLYLRMGCEETLTCAPYHLPGRPGLGDQVAWYESNAVVFANSVLGARTDMYGEFIDVCAAVTGRVPDAGLHRTENRRAQVLFVVRELPPDLLADDILFHVLGHVVGRRTGARVPVIDGLPAATGEDRLRALGAAASAAGSVALFHVVGATPEAPTLDAACGGMEPAETVFIGLRELAAARNALSTLRDGALDAVCIGTPHFSLREFERLGMMLAREKVHPNVRFHVSTSRFVLAEIETRGWRDALESAGVELVADTCTYFPLAPPVSSGAVMTNSAKWAYYAPGGLGSQVAFGSLAECVRSAAAGRVVRDERLWSDR